MFYNLLMTLTLQYFYYNLLMWYKPFGGMEYETVHYLPTGIRTISRT